MPIKKKKKNRKLCRRCDVRRKMLEDIQDYRIFEIFDYIDLHVKHESEITYIG